jgi:hypothetical protein
MVQMRTNFRYFFKVQGSAVRDKATLIAPFDRTIVNVSPMAWLPKLATSWNRMAGGLLPLQKLSDAG